MFNVKYMNDLGISAGAYCRSQRGGDWGCSWEWSGGGGGPKVKKNGNLGLWFGDVMRVGCFVQWQGGEQYDYLATNTYAYFRSRRGRVGRLWFGERGFRFQNGKIS